MADETGGCRDSNARAGGEPRVDGASRSVAAGCAPAHLVVAVIYDHLCLFEFGVASELFGLARPELGIDWYDFRAVSVDPTPVSTLGGTSLAASVDLSLIEEADTVVLPGWRDIAETPPPRMLAAVRAAHHTGARIVSLCSGVFVLAATGLLDGQAATTHWRYTDALARRFPDIEVRPDVLYVDNGSTLTAAGSAAAIDLGLHLIRNDHGTAVANAVARRLVLAPLRDGGQAQFVDTPVPEAQSSLAPVLAWASARLHEPLLVADLAGEAAMSPRTFARRFSAEVGESPHRWLTRSRVNLAAELLETTDRTIDEIAVLAGFGSAPTLRHHFRSMRDTTPTAHRRAFADPGP